MPEDLGGILTQNGLLACVDGNFYRWETVLCSLLKYKKATQLFFSLPQAAAHLLGHTPSWSP